MNKRKRGGQKSPEQPNIAVLEQFNSGIVVAEDFEEEDFMGLSPSLTSPQCTVSVTKSLCPSPVIRTYNEAALTRAKRTSIRHKSSTTVFTRPNITPVASLSVNTSTPVLAGQPHNLTHHASPTPILFQEPSNPVSPALMSNFINGFNKFRILQRWTKFSRCEILYSSQYQELSARALVASISGRQHVMFFVQTTQRELFGFYCTSFVPAPQHVSVTLESEDAFIFSLDQETFKPVQFLRRPDEKKDLIVYPIDETMFVLNVFGAFWITSNARLTVHQLIKNYYNIPMLNPFTSGCSKNCSVQSLFAVEWVDPIFPM